jgi:hypothetical protein
MHARRYSGKQRRRSIIGTRAVSDGVRGAKSIQLEVEDVLRGFYSRDLGDKEAYHQVVTQNSGSQISGGGYRVAGWDG